MQSVCSPDCAFNFAFVLKLKKEKAEDRVKSEAMKTKPELTKIAQQAFNAYIRERDYGLNCICCDKPIAWGSGATGGVCDAGHYLSVGARVNLRFNEDNVHCQNKQCNLYKSGNAVNYRTGLIKKIGLGRVEALESDHALKHYSKDDLREIAATYRAKTRQLEKARNANT